MAIILFTDFGSGDLYVGQVKAALERDAPGVTVIDLLNDAPTFDVRHSAHLLASLVSKFPQGSVFFSVVDPGVGGSRVPVMLRADGYRFVGPDNGLLSVFAARALHAEIFRILWKPRRLSASFHGRDLFAPVAARIAADALPERWLKPLPRLAVEFGAADLAGIVYLDHYGNAMTGIRSDGIPREKILAVNGFRLKYARTFSSVRQGKAFWYENSQGLIEIAVNRGSAAESMKLAIGMPVKWVR